MEKDNLEQYYNNIRNKVRVKDWDFDMVPDEDDTEVDKSNVYQRGDKFCIRGEKSIDSYFVNDDDKPSLYSRLRNPFKEDFIPEEPHPATTRLLAQIVDFDDNGVTATVHYSTHHATKRFSESFRNLLKNKNLLYTGKYFFVVTKTGDDGLNLNVESCDNYSDPKVDAIYEKMRRLSGDA